MIPALPTLNDRRRRSGLLRGPQRRDAFRIQMHMPVHVDAPRKMSCELRDISFLGVSVESELPYSPGTELSFCLEIPVYGAIAEPAHIPLQAEVVRVGYGQTGLRFVDLDRDQARAVQELVATRQRMILAARRSGRTVQPSGG
jgi:c-di-GMP-binding flagellar brake protein YcgR